MAQIRRRLCTDEFLLTASLHQKVAVLFPSPQSLPSRVSLKRKEGRGQRERGGEFLRWQIPRHFTLDLSRECERKYDGGGRGRHGGKVGNVSELTAQVKS